MFIDCVADLTQSSKPTLIATVEKYSLNISAIRSWSFMISLFSEGGMLFPFFYFLVREKWLNIFPKIFILFGTSLFKISTRRIFSNFDDLISETSAFLSARFSVFLKFVSRHVSPVLAFRRTEFIYGTDCDETVLLLTGAWWSTTYLIRELVYHAMSSMSSKISITWHIFKVTSIVWFDKILITSIIYGARLFSGANLFVAAPFMLWKSQRAFRVDIYLQGFVTKRASSIKVCCKSPTDNFG